MMCSGWMNPTGNSHADCRERSGDAGRPRSLKVPFLLSPGARGAVLRPARDMRPSVPGPRRCQGPATGEHGYRGLVACLL